MNNSKDRSPTPTEDAVEAILGQASPRPAPPAAEMAAVRAAVEAEWKTVTRQRHSRRTFVQLAMAASVLLAVFVSLNLLRDVNLEPVFVASINKQFGQISIVDAGQNLIDSGSVSNIAVGQSISTVAAAGIGLHWGNGGSLRIDANTSVRFVSPTEIYLESGRVYFDSTPLFEQLNSAAEMTIQTQFGDVTHIGTRYMAEADDRGLTISVRDGQVKVENDFAANTADKNQQLTATAAGMGGIVNIKSYGDRWKWMESVSPDIDVDGRTAAEFLRWVSQETGLEIQYQSEDATAGAQQTLFGNIEISPREALTQWMPSTTLEWQVDETNGVIKVDQAL